MVMTLTQRSWPLHSAFPPSLKLRRTRSAEIERQLISQRTKEGLARVRVEGKRIGRPKGTTSVNKNLQARDKEIPAFAISFAKAMEIKKATADRQELLSKKVSKSAIARVMEVDRGRLNRYLDSEKEDFTKDYFPPG